MVGTLAAKRPKTGDTVSGVLVKRGFNYHIVSPEELQHYTELSQGVVMQRQVSSATHPPTEQSNNSNLQQNNI